MSALRSLPFYLHQCQRHCNPDASLCQGYLAREMAGNERLHDEPELTFTRRQPVQTHVRARETIRLNAVVLFQLMLMGLVLSMQKLNEGVKTLPVTM